VNKVDINADGVNDMIVRTRWENMNAHSFDRYLIAMTLAGPDYSGPKIYEIPLGESYDYRIETREGAECIVQGYSFRLNQRKMLEVTKYSLGESKENYYCGEAPMFTTHYRLSPSPDGGFGIPYYYLKQIGKPKQSLRMYRDVSIFMGEVGFRPWF